MHRLLIASLIVLATPGTAVAASPSPAASPSASPAPAPLPGEVRINEFLPNPVGTDSGSEWVELANVSDHRVTIGGLTVTRLSGSTLATVPAGTTVEPGAVLLLDQLSGSIVNGGDTLLLTSGQAELDRVTYDGGGSEGWSWSRLSATEGTWSSIPTPGLANPTDAPDDGSGDDTADGGTGGTGVATAATTKASAAAAKATAKTAGTSKSTAKKLAGAGLSGGPYLLAVGLAMLYWYSRRSFL